MLFGMYAPVPHVTVGSKEISRSVRGALDPLPAGEIDPAFTLAKDVLCGRRVRLRPLPLRRAASRRRFRGLDPGCGHQFLDQQHPGHASRASRPVASDADRQDGGLPRPAHPRPHGDQSRHRLEQGRARMYGGDILLHNDDRYIRAEEFVIVLRGMWTQTPFSFDGRFYKVKESQLLLKPATVRRRKSSPRAAASAGWTWWRNMPTGGSSTTTRARPTSPASMESLRRAIDGMDERAATIRPQGALRLQSVRRLRRQRRSRNRAHQTAADARRARRRHAQDDVAGRARR